MEKIRVGIVGLGMAGGAMVPAILAHPDMVLAGAAEPGAELRERFSSEHAGSAVRSVLAMTDILDPARPTEGCCMAMLNFADERREYRLQRL